MKHLLTYMFCALLLFYFSSCKEDDSDLAPIDQLPPLTTTGENTFGCLVNGEAFVTKSSTAAVAIIQGGVLQFFGDIETDQTDAAVSVQLGEFPVSGSTYLINNRKPAKAQYRDYKINCEYETNENTTGFLNIKFLNTEKYIISGTFEFTTVLNELDSGDGCPNKVSITDGRFDIKYIP